MPQIIMPQTVMPQTVMPQTVVPMEGAVDGPLTLVIATNNEHKLQELAAMLADLPIRVRGLSAFPDAPEVDETGATFAENAVLKARAAAEFTGHWAMADDSGLEVDGLDGQPGVYSARFAGPDATDGDNNDKLLRLLQDVPDEKRTARFRCALALVSPTGEVAVDEGTCEGVIARSPRGTGGFGYDPLFVVPELGKTFAELPPSVKDRISHRAKAFAAARRRLTDLVSNS